MVVPELIERQDNPRKVMSSQVHAIILCMHLFEVLPWHTLLRWHSKCHDSRISPTTTDWFVRHQFDFYRAEDDLHRDIERVCVMLHYILQPGREPTLIEATIHVDGTLLAALATTTAPPHKVADLKIANVSLLQIELARARQYQVKAALFV